MSDFEKLKNMNIDEIKNITKISPSRIKDIINKNFADIDSTRAYGFIKILERDLHLNLQDWVQEYEYYKANGNTDNFVVKEITNNQTKEEPQITTKDDKKEYKKITQPPKQKKKKENLNIGNIEVSMPNAKPANKKNVLLIVGLIIILLILLAIYFSNISTNQEDKNIIQQNEIEKKDVEIQKAEAYPKISLQDAMEDSQTNDNTESTKANTQNAKKDSNTESKVANKEENMMTIVTKNQLWFAWVDTETKTGGNKVLNAGDKPFSIKINHPTAFNLGHGFVSFNINGEDFNYNQANVMYLLYSPDTGFKTITQKEYKALEKK